MEVKALTLEEEAELEALKKSRFVALARKEQRIKYRRKQMLYTLRNMEKRGKVLAEMGITARALDELDRDTDCIEWMVNGGAKNAKD
jgi:hypothetical protein